MYLLEMVFTSETIPSRLLMTSSEPSKEEILACLADLKQELGERRPKPH